MQELDLWATGGAYTAARKSKTPAMSLSTLWWAGLREQ